MLDRAVKASGTDAATGNSGVTASAETRLRSNPYLALKNVQCTYRDGVLTLHGCLPTYYLKQRAQAAVAQIDGVERIDNQIEVTATAGRELGR